MVNKPSVTCRRWKAINTSWLIFFFSLLFILHTNTEVSVPTERKYQVRYVINKIAGIFNILYFVYYIKSHRYIITMNYIILSLYIYMCDIWGTDLVISVGISII